LKKLVFSSKQSKTGQNCERGKIVLQKSQNIAGGSSGSFITPAKATGTNDFGVNN